MSQGPGEGAFTAGSRREDAEFAPGFDATLPLRSLFDVSRRDGGVSAMLVVLGAFANAQAPPADR